MIKIIVCDDNREINKKICEIINKTMIQMDIEYTIKRHYLYDQKFMEDLYSDGPKIYVLDIEVQETSGLDIAHIIRKRDLDSPIIIVSAHEELADRAFRERLLILGFISKYFNLEELLQTRVIYKILEDIFQDDLMLVNDRHVKLVRNLIETKKKNSYVYLPHGKRLIKSYDIIEVVESIDEVTSYEIELIDYAVLPNGRHLEVVDEWDSNGNDICRLNSEDITLPLYVRTRNHGDTMSLLGMNGHKKIKDIFIDKKISVSERELWPVVVDSRGIIVWLPGIKKSKFNRKKSEKSDIIIRYY